MKPLLALRSIHPRPSICGFTLLELLVAMAGMVVLGGLILGFLEAGKKRLAGDTTRQATSDEVKELRAESCALKETLGELLMENRLLKKSVLGDGEDDI